MALPVARLLKRDLLSVKAHVGGVSSVAFTRDGKRLVTSGWIQPRQGLGDPRSGDVKFWDTTTGQPLRFSLNGPADKVREAVLSPDGTHLAAAGGMGNPTILVWHLATRGLVTLEGPAKHTAFGVAFSRDGKRLACNYAPDDDVRKNGSQRSIRIWDLATREAVATIDRVPSGHVHTTLSPDGKLLAGSVLSLGLVKVWDAVTGRETFSCNYTDGGILWEVAFSPDGKRLAAFASKGIRIWDVASRETQATWPSDSKGSADLAFSPDGNRLAIGGIEGLVELWDTATGQKVQTFKGHFGPVHAIAFSPDGTRLATGCADGTLRLWDATARQDAIAIPQDGRRLTETPELSPDGQTLADGFPEWSAQPSTPVLGHRDG